MQKEWKVTKIGDICYVYDGPHATPRKTLEGPVFLGISCLNKGLLDLTDAEHLSEEDYKKWTRRVEPRVGDVVFSYETRIGEAAIIPKDIRCCLGRRMGLLRARDGIVDSHFLLYEYLSPEFQDILRVKMVTGSTVERILLTEMPSFNLRLPPLPEQRAIAHILGTLDDKIELNRKMNETLEAMAKAIFKSWFVDFDPVRAKMEGREPAGMDAETAALFPDGFEESELGEIPRGWRVNVIDNTIKVISGGTPKTSISEYWNGNIPWFTPKDSPPSAQIFVIDTERHITELGLEKSATQLLPEGTTIITARGTVGKLALTGVPMAMNQTCYGIRGREDYPDYYIYYCLNNLLNELKQKTHGTVFETITTDTFKTIISIIPPVKLAVIYHNQIHDFMNKIKINLFESRTLAQIRDALLPKLLSGEIRVGEAEKVVESAV